MTPLSIEKPQLPIVKILLEDFYETLINNNDPIKGFVLKSPDNRAQDKTLLNKCKGMIQN